MINFLLQSGGNKIRVFPAMPGSWQDASFDLLRAQGVFVVSAVRKKGKVQWVAIKSLAGEPFVVKIVGWKDLNIVGNNKYTVTKLQEGEFQVDLKKGEQAVVCEKGKPCNPLLVAIAHDKKLINAYGVKKAKQLKEKQFWEELSSVYCEFIIITHCLIQILRLKHNQKHWN